MRLAFVQHGDYAETVGRFARGLGETYYAQRYSVEFVAGLAHDCAEVCVICVTAGPYDVTLPTCVRAIGIPRRGDRVDEGTLFGTLERLAPTHLILRSPLRRVLAWALEKSISTLPLLADSFRLGLRYWWRNRGLAKLLNNSGIEWVGNHNVNAARSLEQIGVEVQKIIPWDWPPAQRPEENPVKELQTAQDTFRLIFVGTLSEAKGTGDLIMAVSELCRRGLTVHLTVVGPGDRDRYSELANSLNVDRRVTLTGRIDHSEVLKQMRAHDVVIVPSRHAYAEGLPMTIYDAFASRTPLVASDHPMFRGKVEHGRSGRIFRAGDTADLADQIEQLLSKPEEYRRYSAYAPDAFRRIECPAKWAEIIERWLCNSETDRAWLNSHTLGSGRYDAC